MPLTILTDGSITLSTSFDANGDLQASHGTNALQQYGDTLIVGHELEPVRAPIELTDPQGGWQVDASHTLDSGTLTEWTRPAGATSCRYVWNETAHEYEVTVVASNGSATAKEKKIFIKVRPASELPDPTAP